MSRTAQKINLQNFSELQLELAEKQKILKNALRQLDKLETQLRERDLLISKLKQSSDKAAVVSVRWYRWYRKRFPKRVKCILDDLDIPNGEKFEVFALAAIRSDQEIKGLMAERRREKRRFSQRLPKMKDKTLFEKTFNQTRKTAVDMCRRDQDVDVWKKVFHELGGGK